MKWGNAVAGCVVISAMSIQVGCGESGDSSSSTQLAETNSFDFNRARRCRSRQLSDHSLVHNRCDRLSCQRRMERRAADQRIGNFFDTDSGMIKFTLSCTGAGGSTTNTAKSPVHRGISPP